MLVPPPLKPDALIRVLAPSGPFDAALLHAGCQRLERWQVEPTRITNEDRSGFFAASEERRGAELQAALDDARIACIWVARGGYGIGPLLPRLDWGSFIHHPKWLVGFSDATALHLEAWKRGIVSLHAANGTTLARTTDTDWRLLEGILQGQTSGCSPVLCPLRAGTASGTLVGGNLTVLFTEAAAGRLALPAEAIVVLEDVTETSYRVDRMLDALLRGGQLRDIGGVVFGEFTSCNPGKFDVPVEDVLERFAERWGGPVWTGLPLGHGADNLPLPLGSHARIEGDVLNWDLRA